VSEIREAYKNKTPISGALTGFRSLDEMLNGLWPGQLVVCAAGTGNGKSTLALNIAENFAERGEAVLYASLEMSRKELLIKSISREARISSTIISSAQFTNIEQATRFGEAIGRVKEKFGKLYVQDDGTSLTIPSLRAEAQRMKRDGLGLIVVDYLQLMDGGQHDTRSQEVAVITRSLKLLAMRTQVPVLALSQFNREGSKSERPRLYHLKESGSIEQDADVVFFIHDPSQHDMTKEADGTMELLIEKNRRGQTGEVKLAFNRTYSRFAELLQVAS